ncbi:hypothetical protein N9502_02175 [Vicingaceae bacterium]|nr:hypothetical protein [Vicingaceae bacterium]
MEYLGGRNLFTSHFIIGCREVNRKFTKTETLEIEALHKWLDFKDNDWGMDRYRTNRTRYIAFLETIELETFKEITEGLYQSYCKEFPYSTKKDFIKYVFDYTIFDLERFLKMDLHWLGEAPNENNYSFYTVYSQSAREFLDFVINSKFLIEHYKQYYKVILEYLKSFENDNTKQAIPPHPIVKQRKIEETPKTFEELFYNTDLVIPSIDILKELDPPLIDTDCNYIGKLKGIICVWIDELKRQGIIKSSYPEERKLFALLIPQKIKRFSIDESMFGKYHQKAEDNYRTDIKTKISKIKLSQNSH